MTRAFPGRFVIDNRPGAGGVIGVEALLRAEADGYTLVAAATGSLAVAPKLLTRKSFSSADFAPIGPMATTPMVLEVNARSPHRTFAEFVAHARADPGRTTIGHAGYGTTNHVAILLMQRALGASFNVVSYRGSAPAITDLLGGQIDAVVDQISSSIGYLKGGSFRPLAVTTRARAGDIPDTPTLDELGLKGFDAGTTVGLLAPARTPPATVATLNAALNAALREPALDGRLRALGAVAQPSSPEALLALLRGEEEKADLLIRDGVLKPE